MNADSRGAHDRTNAPAESVREIRSCSICGARFSATAENDFCPICLLRAAAGEAVEPEHAGSAKAVERGPIPAGQHQVRMEFAYDGGGLGKGGTATLFIDGKRVGTGRVTATAPMIFSCDDGCDVGQDTGAPVSPDHGPRGTAAPGRVRGVQLAIAEAAERATHMVSPEEALRVAMARQ